ncbi:MAG TPA: hypothetical protein ENJ32_14345 [Crenotrichaceae bacterium]|nr:hypothetical protein [Crenotrichaceae bacterium]
MRQIFFLSDTVQPLTKKRKLNNPYIISQLWKNKYAIQQHMQHACYRDDAIRPATQWPQVEHQTIPEQQDAGFVTHLILNLICPSIHHLPW